MISSAAVVDDGAVGVCTVLVLLAMRIARRHLSARCACDVADFCFSFANFFKLWFFQVLRFFSLLFSSSIFTSSFFLQFTCRTYDSGTHITCIRMLVVCISCVLENKMSM